MSFEQTKSFVEKLARVRSLHEALELQTNCLKQTNETLTADSQKTCELHREMAKQGMVYLERLWSR
ncbi:phasin family protein [Bradyrhizobium elkanii]|uniref:phasin family protein n=1 Tax=Bradyrhizobium TaxID=374 RepID=UPI001FD2E8C4|nr:MULTISPECIES: phasin family protein [Bradyrhizobium]MDI2111432.1 phasin family protein [Bradyrhizobium sp. Mp64]WLA52714.1 phasin family protein [Bradyrhizobium elkanii]WLB14056.1 phasin family protein [Bradyrhizobium elkanii]WLB76884.1 phasin family protein [Bradyrhizobium elkanii]WLB85344.1 phasin family protein [Bradyrhizobium elkanii]